MIRNSFLSLLGLFMAGTAKADWALNMPKGVTDLSLETYNLHMMVFWWCVAIGVVVFGVMIISLIKHRKSKGAEPATFSHSTTCPGSTSGTEAANRSASAGSPGPRTAMTLPSISSFFSSFSFPSLISTTSSSVC